MARLKEQSRLERERRHLEKTSKRKLQEEEEMHSKKSRHLEPPVVTVSDNSEGEIEEVYDDQDEKSDVTPQSHSSGKRSRSISRRSNEVNTVILFCFLHCWMSQCWICTASGGVPEVIPLLPVHSQHKRW